MGFMIKSLSVIKLERKLPEIVSRACLTSNQAVIHVGHALASPVVELKLLPDWLGSTLYGFGV